ncbi:MAG: peptidase S8, partial [Burkholderiales bacterium]|nr:peptidase S8 [Opitutaceae bacterium]
MQTRSPIRFAAFVALAAVLGVAIWRLGGWAGDDSRGEDADRLAFTLPAEGEGQDVAVPGADDSAEARAAIAAVLRERLNRKHVRSDEAVLTFKDADAYRRFLARARDAGLQVLGKIDGLYAVRVRVGDYDAFVGELAGNRGDYAGISSNVVLAAPTPPAEDRAARAAVAGGDNLLASLGLAEGANVSAWGKGVTIAVLDGGASPDATLGTRLKYLDIGYG